MRKLTCWLETLQEQKTTLFNLEVQYVRTRARKECAIQTHNSWYNSAMCFKISCKDVNWTMVQYIWLLNLLDPHIVWNHWKINNDSCFFSILKSPNICILFIQAITKATNVPDMWAKTWRNARTPWKQGFSCVQWAVLLRVNHVLWTLCLRTTTH